MSATPTGQASEKAIEAGQRVACANLREGTARYKGRFESVPLIANAMHDPSLGPDRSVCLKDVLDWLCSDELRIEAQRRGWISPVSFAAALELRFGGTDG